MKSYVILSVTSKIISITELEDILTLLQMGSLHVVFAYELMH